MSLSVYGTTFAGIIVSLVPSFIFLVILIDPYEKDVKDDILYRGFFMGFILGFVAYLLEAAGFFGFRSDAPDIAFFSIFGLSFVHPMVMGMVLNKKNYQEKRETIAMGAALGFGFAASYGFTIFAGGLIIGDLDTGYDQFFGVLFVQATSLLLGATGVFIGYGVYGELYKRYVSIAIVIHFVPNLLKFIRLMGAIPQELLVLALLIYGVVAYQLVRRDFMPHVAPDSARKMKTDAKLIIKKKLE